MRTTKEREQICVNAINVEILSVNGFIEWSDNILGHSGPILFCVFFFFFLFFCCWLGFVFDENLRVAEEL